MLPCWRLLQDFPEQGEGDAGGLAAKLEPHWLGRGTPISLAPLTVPTYFPLSPRFSEEQTKMMMVSSRLKNSRITLLMGFSALRSCGNCSAASMIISLTI